MQYNVQHDSATILQKKKNLWTVQYDSTLLLLQRVRVMVMIVH